MGSQLQRKGGGTGKVTSVHSPPTLRHWLRVRGHADDATSSIDWKWEWSCHKRCASWGIESWQSPTWKVRERKHCRLIVNNKLLTQYSMCRVKQNHGQNHTVNTKLRKARISDRVWSQVREKERGRERRPSHHLLLAGYMSTHCVNEWITLYPPLYPLVLHSILIRAAGVLCCMIILPFSQVQQKYTVWLNQVNVRSPFKASLLFQQLSWAATFYVDHRQASTTHIYLRTDKSY